MEVGQTPIQLALARSLGIEVVEVMPPALEWDQQFIRPSPHRRDPLLETLATPRRDLDPVRLGRDLLHSEIGCLAFSLRCRDGFSGLRHPLLETAGLGPAM